MYFPLIIIRIKCAIKYERLFSHVGDNTFISDADARFRFQATAWCVVCVRKIRDHVDTGCFRKNYQYFRTLYM